jgi:hypothetical protein
MGGKPQHHPEMIETRARRADGGEPLYSDRMSVHYNGNSLVIGLTSTGCDVLGVTEDDDLTVEVHDDGFWVDLGGDSDE